MHTRLTKKNWHYEVLNDEACDETPLQKVEDYAHYSMRTTDRGSFMVFSHESVNDVHSKSLQTKNWKAHLSIHIYDIPNAWNIIFPLFINYQCELFKVTRLSSIPAALSEINQSNFKRHHQYPETEYINIERSMEARAGTVTRVALGNEITIYPTQGKEWQCRLLLCEIEAALSEIQCHPGIFDVACRQVGVYTSIRHTGLGEAGYTSAIAVRSYNPDDVFEMFYPFTGMVNFLLTFKRFLSFSENLAEDIKIHIFNHLSEITNVLTLQDLVHLLDMPEYKVLNAKPAGFSIFKDSHKSEIIAAIKARALEIVTVKAILFPEEDQIVRDILSIKRNKYDSKTPRSLQNYESLLLDQQIRIARPASDPAIRAAHQSRAR